MLDRISWPPALLISTFLLLLPQPANAECTSTGFLGDLSNSGYVRMQAITTQADCGGARTVYVRAWIAASMEFACLTGYRISGYYCGDHSSERNASTTLGGFGYGYWDGYGSHWYVQAGGSGDLAPTHRRLWAGSPPQPSQEQRCWEIGGTWDPVLQYCEPPPNTPIIIATSMSAAYRLTSPEKGVMFDIDADGTPERIAWTEPNSDVAFLAWDRDGDGMITSGRELFGNHTFPGVANGFDALIRAAKDTNDGIVGGSVNVEDPIFAQLLLWTDTNHNGISEPSELRPVMDLFSDIGLGYQLHSRKDGQGNQFIYRGWATIRTAPGRNRARTPTEMNQRGRIIYDVALATLPH